MYGLLHGPVGVVEHDGGVAGGESPFGEGAGDVLQDDGGGGGGVVDEGDFVEAGGVDEREEETAGGVDPGAEEREVE